MNIVLSMHVFMKMFAYLLKPYHQFSNATACARLNVIPLNCHTGLDPGRINVIRGPGPWLAGRPARILIFFFDFSEMSQKGPLGPQGPWGTIFRYFPPIFGPPGGPLGGALGGPWGPPIFPGLAY